MRIPQPKPGILADAKRPEPPRRPPGLLLYGALTILGGLALIVAAE